MLVAALTLIPAIMALLGRAAFWPFRPRFDPALAARPGEAQAGGVWSWIAARVARAPALVLSATAVLFLLMSLGVFRLEQTFDSLTALPEGTESREGFELLRAAFPAGELAPTEVYVVLPSGSGVTGHLDGLGQLTVDLARQPGVAAVTSAAYPFGLSATAAENPAAAPSVGPDAVADASAAIPEPVREAIARGEVGGPAGSDAVDEALVERIGLYAASQRYVSPDNAVARFDVSLERNPYSLTAIEEIPGLRDAAKSAAVAAGLPVDRADVLVGGETATAYDTKVANDRDIRIVLPLILAAIGIILGLLLRSVVAPLYLLATIVLSYFATLGLATVVFQDLLGQSGVNSGVPFLLFVFSAALGVDYSIYLMTRVREEVAQHELTDGVRRALSRTGGVITLGRHHSRRHLRGIDDLTAASPLSTWIRGRGRRPDRHVHRPLPDGAVDCAPAPALELVAAADRNGSTRVCRPSPRAGAWRHWLRLRHSAGDRTNDMIAGGRDGERDRTDGIGRGALRRLPPRRPAGDGGRGRVPRPPDPGLAPDRARRHPPARARLPLPRLRACPHLHHRRR